MKLTGILKINLRNYFHSSNFKLVEKSKMKNLIIGKARQIFTSVGYHNATMNDIARSVKKGKSSIYYYYKSKEDIFNAVIFTEGRLFRSAIINAINEKNDPLEKVKMYVLIRMETFNTLKNFHNALRSESLKNIEFVRRLNKIYYKEEVRLFKKILREGVESNYFYINDIDLAAIAIITAMRGMETNLLMSESMFHEKLDAVISIIFYGIVKRPENQTEPHEIYSE